MKRILPTRLRGRLLVLLLLALLPSLALLAHAAWRSRLAAEREAEARAAQLVRLGAGSHLQLVEGARGLLAGLALAPAVRALDPGGCAPVFSRLAHSDPSYAEVAVADVAGRIVASHGGAGGDAEVGPEDWFRRALGSGETVVSRFEAAPGGGAPRTVVATAVRGADGVPVGVLWVGLRLDWMERVAAEIRGVPGGTVMVVDGRGVVLSRFPDPEGWSGRGFRDAGLVHDVRARREGVARLPGLDGARRIWAFAPVATGADGEAFLAVGFHESGAVAAAQRTFVRSLVALLLLGALTALLAWHGAAIVVLRPVERMVAAARALAIGDFRARAGPPYSSSELGELARAFDELGDALRRRRLEREVAETALRDLSARRAAVVEGSPDGIVTLDAGARILEVNSAAERLFGWPRGRLLGSDFVGLLVPDDLQEASRRAFASVAEGGDAPWLGRPAETRARRADGAEFPVEFAMTRIALERGGPLFSLYIRDVTHRRRHEQALRSLSLVDDLTGLYNRRGFLAFGQQQLRVADRSGRELTVLFADLDGLKAINDRHGHAEGDRAIVSAANVLRATFRRSDVIGRLGGDEFAALALETTPTSLARLEMRLAERIAAVNRAGRHPWRLAMSMGRARYDPARPCSIEQLIARADEAMYRRKRDRRAGAGGTPAPAPR